MDSQTVSGLIGLAGIVVGAVLREIFGKKEKRIHLTKEENEGTLAAIQASKELVETMQCVIEELKQQVAELKNEIARLAEENSQLRARIGELNERVNIMQAYINILENKLRSAEDA